MNIRRWMLAALLTATSTAAALGHPPEFHQQQAKQQAALDLPQGLVLPSLEGPRPWSDKPVLNDPERFQIAIMTDRTGGHRPGIWMQAVKRLNLLRPEFVMSVGDLIEGYTNDREQVEKEWQEFLGFIDQMEMRFFFVAGNHDVTNPMMHEIWRKHFGKEYYSFDYKGVHFVCLLSEDPVAQLGAEQLAWLKDDLAKSRDARWTLLFLHKPLWVYSGQADAEGSNDKTGWKQVEKLLGGRPHTVFAGHVHHYVQYERNGMQYYHLATTGGGSRLRGIPYGEFDHITWLTMEKDGPHVAHLLLDGVLAPDVVTEKGIARFRSYLANTQIEVAPILIADEGGLAQGRIQLRLANNFSEPVAMTGEIAGLPLRGLTVDPEQFQLTAQPGKSSELAVDVIFNEPMPFSRLTKTVLTAKLRTTGEGEPLTSELTVPVIIDRRYPCPAVATKPKFDGDLAEWPELQLATGEQPQVLGKSEQWNGPGDGSFAFTTAHDDEYLYVAGRVTDDKVFKGDGIELRLDARSISARHADSRLAAGTYSIRLTAPDNNGDTELVLRSYRGDRTANTTRTGSRREENGYTFELAVPLATITKQQGDNWHSVQFTPVLFDVDEPGETAVRLVWRGTADVDSRNTGFGHFTRD